MDLEIPYNGRMKKRSSGSLSANGLKARSRDQLDERN
jgi:hypothetical protein